MSAKCAQDTYHGFNEDNGLKGKVNTHTRHFHHYLLDRLLELSRVETISGIQGSCPAKLLLIDINPDDSRSTRSFAGHDNGRADPSKFKNHAGGARGDLQIQRFLC